MRGQRQEGLHLHRRLPLSAEERRHRGGRCQGGGNSSVQAEEKAGGIPVPRGQDSDCEDPPVLCGVIKKPTPIS